MSNPNDLVEVRIRRFFTCDEADVTPSVTIVGKVGEIAKVKDWNKVIAAHAELADDQIKNIPATNLRPMTADEIQAYRASEDDD